MVLMISSSSMISSKPLFTYQNNIKNTRSSNDIRKRNTKIDVSNSQQENIIKKTKRKRTISSKNVKQDIPFNQMTKEEKDKCLKKWHSFADEDAPIEIKRFQVLVAARLHCQAHESVVRSAMSSLKEFVTSSPVTTNTTTTTTYTAQSNTDKDKVLNENTTSSSSLFLDTQTLSSADPLEVAKVISSVLFANVKAKQIVKAAEEVKTRFHGVVPESQHGLQMITGVGPKLAEVLYHINCRKDYVSH